MAKPKVTAYLLFLTFTICLGSMQFGYHLGEMNTPGYVMSCRTNKKASLEMPSWIPGCIPMNEGKYGFVTSIYSIGGLFGSLYAPQLADGRGRRGAALINCSGFVLGPIVMALSPNVWILALGRVISGLSSGVAMVLVPIYLNEIAPKSLRGAFGVTCQVFVVIGIAIAQFLGLFLSTIPYWRLILLFGGVIGAVHFVLLLFACESPKWVALQPGGQSRGSVILRRIRGEESDHEVRDWRRRSLLPTENDGLLDFVHVLISDAEEALLASTSASDSILSPISSGTSLAKETHNKLTLWQFIRSPSYRPMLRAVMLIMLAQQLSGINAVIFYSTSILSAILPSSSALISLIISLVNLATTLPSTSLIERSGRKPLLLWSISSMGIASLFLGLGIVFSWRLISVIASLAFVAGFSIGLGPIPFLIISEFVDAEAVSAGQSFGLVTNWIATFCVGYFFPILNEWWGGYVFIMFAAISAFFFVMVSLFIPETKDLEVDEVWGSRRD